MLNADQFLRPGMVGLLLGASIIPGSFLERPNRFAARVEVDGRPILAHVPNSGWMRELLVAGGMPVWLVPAVDDGRRSAGTPRKTAYDLVAVRHRGIWVSIDSRLPGRLLRQAIAAGDLTQKGRRKPLTLATGIRRTV